MNINASNPENLTENKKLLWALTKGPSMSVKDIDDREELTPAAWCVYTDEDKDGKEQEVLAIWTEERGVVSTISKTFKREFFDLDSLMDGESYKFHVSHGTTKAGREFVTCVLAMPEM